MSLCCVLGISEHDPLGLEVEPPIGRVSLGSFLKRVGFALPDGLPRGRCRVNFSFEIETFIGILLLGGNGVGGEPGICDGRMPLSTGQTNTVPPKRCDTPCLAQGRPKLRNICMTVRRRSPDGQRHRTVMQKALRNRSPPSASPPSKESRFQSRIDRAPFKG